MSRSASVHPIRPALPADRQEWLRLRRLLWPKAALEELEPEMAAMLRNSLTPVFVAERLGGGLGGFLEAGTRPYADGCDTSPVAYIEGWFVDEDLRNKGLGRALVEAAEAWARGQGLHEIASDSLIANLLGRRAHLALGYRDVEHVIHYAKRL